MGLLLERILGQFKRSDNAEQRAEIRERGIVAAEPLSQFGYPAPSIKLSTTCCQDKFIELSFSLPRWPIARARSRSA